MSINKVILIGHVGKEPEIKTTSDGKEFALFSLATSKKWKDKQGNKQEKTQWHRICSFGGVVDIIKSYVHQGSKLYVEGELEYNQYEKDGVKQYSCNVTLRGFNSKLTLLTPKQEGSMNT